MTRTNITQASEHMETPPSPSQQTLPSATELQIQTIHSQISCQITTLQTNSIHYSKPQNRYYSLLIPCLPPLLSQNRMEGLSYLRHTFLTLANTNMGHLDPEEKRYTNIGSSFLWALDNAENAASCVAGDAPLRLMKALSNIVHVVTRLCNREWGLENSSESPYHILDTSQLMEEQLIIPNRDELTGNQLVQRSHRDVERVSILTGNQKDMRTSYSSLFGSMPEYMHRVGNSITASERQRYIQNGCLLPLSLVLKEYEIDKNNTLPHPKQEYVEMMYKDRKLFECISIRCARIPYDTMSRNLTTSQQNSEGSYLGTLEIDITQHQTMMKLCKKAYHENFGCTKRKLVMVIPKHFTGMRTQIRSWILPSCFVRVQDGDEYMEWPIRKALDMCQHDLYGVGLLEVGFLDEVDKTLVSISLIGIVVERDLLNYDDAVFRILDT